MYEATKHLLELGHKRFFYVGGPAGTYHEVERRKGMSECLRNAAINPRDIAMCNGDFLLQSGTSAAEQFLSLQRRPTGVICCNDLMAIGFMKRMRSAGLRIPEDVAVVGFDGIEYGEYCDPTLTTCKQPTLELGKAGVRLLLDIIENKTESKASRVVLDSKLVVRGSTVKAAVVDGKV
jgi:LacI family repressor for deo operon, udp, cdd, tsx, nupC, and nupG